MTAVTGSAVDLCAPSSYTFRTIKALKWSPWSVHWNAPCAAFPVAYRRCSMFSQMREWSRWCLVCDCPLFFIFYLFQLEVQAPPGNPIGYITQNWHPYLPKLTIQNEKMEDVLKIVGPFCACKCCSDVNFKVKQMQNENIFILLLQLQYYLINLVNKGLQVFNLAMTVAVN